MGLYQMKLLFLSGSNRIDATGEINASEEFKSMAPVWLHGDVKIKGTGPQRGHSPVLKIR